ncbi:sensor histidine kinase [Nitrospirota bacterium]
MHPDSKEEFLHAIDMALKEGRHFELDYGFFRKDGSEAVLHTIGSLLRDESGSPAQMVGIVEDITERKKVEAKIKASLREKEVLLQEIHHRVKNNMAIITSLLRLQSRFTENEEIKEILKESQNRIKSMALVHEKLYLEGDLSRINYRDYVENLVNDLCSFYNLSVNKIKIVFDVEDIPMEIDVMIPCGLILNELITNSMKYAFKDIETPVLYINLSSQDDRIILVVGDNGPGIPEDIDIHHSKSFGLQIVDGLVRQLRGSIELDSSEGTIFTISFALQEKAND